jgi:hypothetical protein
MGDVPADTIAELLSPIWLPVFQACLKDDAAPLREEIASLFSSAFANLGDRVLPMLEPFFQTACLVRYKSLWPI